MSFIKELKHLRGNKKGLFFIFVFRISNFFATSNIVVKIIGFPFRLFYLFFVQWTLGIDVPDRTDIGFGFDVWHGMGLVIHPDCKIGNYVKVRHTTTIGQKNENKSRL